MPDRAFWPKARPHYRRLVIVGCLIAAVCAYLRLFGPEDIGRWAHVSCMLAALACVGLGPLARGARPLRVWGTLTAAATMLTAAFLLTQFAPTPTLGPSDALYLGGYSTIALWFVLLDRHIGGVTTLRVLLDSFAAVTTTAIVLWGIPTVHTRLGMIDYLLQWGIYPFVDAVGVALAVHLALRTGRQAGASWWLVAALVAELAVDTLLALNFVAPQPFPQDRLYGCMLVPYSLLAITCTHPSLVRMEHLRVAPEGPPRRPWRVAQLYLAVIPGVVFVAMPASGPADLLIRLSLTMLLLVLLFIRLFGSLYDLTQAEGRARLRASRDPLTGLLNRSALFEELDRRLRRDRREGHSTALLFIDCDHFKSVNDRWGHAAGDALILAIAQGVPSQLRSDDIMARNGGDEFVIAAGVGSEADALGLAERVRTWFDRDIPLLPGVTCRVTPSIGVAVSAPGASTTSLELLTRADIALYAAKEAGRARVALYDADLDAATRRRATLTEALRSAVEHDLVDIELQPVFKGAGFAVPAGWEALARWHHPDLGTIDPDVFIPLAEEIGIIHRLDSQVLQRALRALQRIRTVPGQEDAAIAVNVSTGQLRREGFADEVAALLARYEVPPQLLMVEISERPDAPATSDTLREIVLANLEALERTGVMVCLDDFGTGHSSFTSLMQMPVFAVKLDRSIVSRAGSDPQADLQVRSVVRLVRALKIRAVIAVGVETAEQADLMRAAGCDMAQGWWFGRPRPLDDILRNATPPPTLPTRAG